MLPVRRAAHEIAQDQARGVRVHGGDLGADRLGLLGRVVAVGVLIDADGHALQVHLGVELGRPGGLADAHHLDGGGLPRQEHLHAGRELAYGLVVTHVGVEAVGGALQEGVLAPRVGLRQRDAADLLAVVGVEDTTQVQGEGPQAVAQAQDREGFGQGSVVEGTQPCLGAHLPRFLEAIIGARVPRGSAHEGTGVVRQVQLRQVPLDAHPTHAFLRQATESRKVGALRTQDGAVIARGQHQEGLRHAPHAIGWHRARTGCPRSKPA